jgi:signal transduction histidine kinase/ligand-binding sensor domain-containing protein
MRRIKIITVFFLLFIINGAFYISGQERDINFSYLTTNDGLSTNRVRTVYRDSKGYLWIGTEAGLDKYDSYQIKTYRYNENQPGSISNNDIWCILEDSKKNIWIATSNGLNLYNAEKDSFTIFKSNPEDSSSIDNNRVNGIMEDSRGNIWVTTYGNCLNRWIPSKKAFVRYRIPSNFGYNKIQEDSKGNIWIVSRNPGIKKFNPKTGKLTFYNYTEIPAENSIKNLYIDKNDKIWIASRGNGFFNFDPNSGKFTHIDINRKGKDSYGDIIAGIVEEDDRYLWLPLDKGGINVYDKVTKTFSYLNYSDSKTGALNNEGVWGIYKDNENIIWVCTTGGGINYYNPKKNKFKLFKHEANNPNSLSFNVVNCLYEDSEGLIWIGTDGGGVNIFDPKNQNFKHLFHDPSNKNTLSYNTIRCITQDKNGDMWIGTWAMGFNRIDKKTGKIYRYMPKTGNATALSIWHMTIDHNGLIWMGVLDNGVYLFDKDKGWVDNYHVNDADPKSLSNSKIWYLFEDSRKIMWICTNDGLNKYDSIHKNFTVYNHLPSKVIKAITEDKSKNLWVATEKGICQINPNGKILQAYDESNGLSNNQVQGIVCDNDGNIWISTLNGICKFDPHTKKFRHFTQNEGLQDKAFFQQSFMKTRKGEIYFGGFKGFNSFKPETIQDNSVVPPVYISGFQIFNKPVPFGVPGSPLSKPINITREITLSYKHSVFSFSFIAINYTYPEKNSYAYKMEGFDSDWNYTDASRRTATYTNLDPGEYVFRVKASNNDGIWNNNDVSLKINILPPWWQTSWFIVLSVIACISAAVAYYLYKINFYKRQKQLLEYEVSQRTKELKDANEELITQTEIVKHTNLQLEERQQYIEEQAEKLAENNQELIKLNATKDKFFSIIGHDLRNPFNTVIGFTEILIQKYPILPHEKIEKYLHFIYTSSVSGNELLTNLLMWSRSQTGELKFNPEQQDIAYIIDQTAKLLDGNAQTKNITIEQVVKENLNCWFDENMMKTVIRNLVSNAIKFTGDNGKIIIKAEIANDIVTVSVEDNGIGIPEDIRRNLFNHDIHITTKGTSNESGTGLGLILCKEYVEKHSGKIWVESEVGKGSKFIFTFPASM